MRLGILSDTHDHLDRTRRAVEALIREGAEVLVHCGDLTGPGVLAACGVLPCYFVFGNNDSDNVSNLRRVAVETGAVCLEWGDVVELGGKRIGVTHGHMRIDVKRVLAQQPDYFFSGHSHVADDFREGCVRRINPGALHRAEEYTVALLDLERDELACFRVSP